MKLKKYQIDAIVEETLSRVKEVRNSKKVSISKLDSECKELLKLKKEYDKLSKEKDAIQDRMNKLGTEYHDKTSRYIGATQSGDETDIQNYAIVKKYGKLPTANDIERKLVIADLGSDFNVEDFIKSILEVYE